MTTPWRSVQDAEKANETVGGKRCHAVYQGVAYPNTENWPWRMSSNCSRRNGAKGDERAVSGMWLEPVDLTRAEGESG